MRRATITVCCVLFGGLTLTAAAPDQTAAPHNRAVAKRAAQPPAIGYDWQSKGRNNSQAAYENDTHMSATIAPTLGVYWMSNLLSADVGGPTIAYNPAFGKPIVYSGDERGDLSATDEANGTVLWSTSMGAGDSIYSTPLISTDQTSIWVGTAYKPMVYKLDTATGTIQCGEKQLLPIQASPTEGMASDGTEQVYISTIQSPTAGGPELAYRESDCALMFSSNPYKVPNTGAWASPSYGVDAHGRRLVFQGTADPDSTEYAIDATTGELDWYFITDQHGDYDIGAASTVSPPGKNGFADGVVYVVAKDLVCYALDLTTGKAIWEFNFAPKSGPGLGNARSTAALDGNTLVFGMADGAYALNATTGAKLWHYTDAAQAEVISSPAIVGPPGQEVTAFADVAGEFHVLRLADGKELYHYQTGNYITGSPSYYLGHFLIASADGFLYNFAAGGGNGALPVTAITNPTQGATIPYASTIAIAGTAADPGGVSAVQVAVQSGGSSGMWYNAATGTWSSGARTNVVAVAQPGAKSTTWSFTVPVPPSGTTFAVYANAVNQTHLADVKGAQVNFNVSGSTSEPRLRTSTVFIAPGATFVATGYGFTPNEQVKFTVAGTILGSANADATGKVTASLTLPTTSLFGNTPLSATGVKSLKTGSTPIDVANAWLQAGYDSAHTAFEPNDLTFQHVIDPGNNDFLFRAWYYLAGAPVESSPAVYDGAVYFGNDAGTLAAVGADTAAPLWTLALPDGAAIRSTPAIDPATGTLTFTADDGDAYIVTAATGAAIGSATIGGLLTSPNAHNGAIYVGSDNATLVSLNEQTGARNWTDTLAAAVHSTPALDTATGTVVVGDDSGAVSAFNNMTGTMIWQAKTGGPVTAPPAIVAGIVYAGSADGNLYALNETSGAPVWKFSAGIPIVTNSPYDSFLSLIYVAGANSEVYAINAADGSLAWETSAPNARAAYVGLSAVNAYVIGNNTAGSVLAYRTNQFGRFNSNHKTNAALMTAPAIDDGTVYIGASDGGVYAFTPYGHTPQIVPAGIRRSQSVLDAGRPQRGWRGTRATVVPQFSWFGQRDIAIHRDTTARANMSAHTAALVYHGGPVQHAPHTYAVFWKPAGTTLETRYISGVSSAFAANAGQTGGALDGIFIDSAPRPAQMSDGAVQAEIAKTIALQHWPTDINTRFVLFTANGLIAPGATFCSYHSAFALAHDRSKMIVYGVIPYSGAVSACETPSTLHLTGDPAVDAANVNLTRIERELTNDPLLSGWFGTDGGEIGAL